jgi:hypothetical protein
MKKTPTTLRTWPTRRGSLERCRCSRRPSAHSFELLGAEEDEQAIGDGALQEIDMSAANMGDGNMD